MKTKKLFGRTRAARFLIIAFTLTLQLVVVSFFSSAFALLPGPGPAPPPAGAAPPVSGPGFDCRDIDNLALVCLEGIFANALKAILSLTGIVSFLFIIRGGVKYTTAGGDMKAMDGARKTLTWAVAGLGFSLISYFILQLLSQTFSFDILKFIIPPPAP